MDIKHSDRPERRTAIIARELRRFRIDIAALSETRLADEGQLKEEKGGRPKATVVSAYAPTLDAQDADLDNILTKVPKEDKLILLGDFNARVGRNHNLWRGTIGKEGVGNTNSNGILLLSKCSEHSLVITNTLFRQKNKLKTSWMHPRSKLWHLIDYVVVRTKDRHDVLNTRAMTSADDCWTDHRLIRSIMSISLMRKRRVQKRQCRPKLNIERLGDTTFRQQLQATLSADLPKQYSEDIETHWDLLKSITMDSCKSTLGYKTRKHQDWCDENDNEIQQLIDIKRQTFIAWQNDINCKAKRAAHAKAKAAVQSQIRQLKNQWWTRKALEIQQLADCGDTRGFFDATRAVYGPSHRCLAPLRSKDGLMLLKDNESMANRWKEHYEELLNRDTTPEMEALDQLPQQPINENMGAPPSWNEVQDAIRKMKNNKAAGPDGIPAEILKDEDKRKLRTFTKKAQSQPTTTTTHPCPHCTKICGSRIGLFAHLKTHRDPKGGQSYSTSSDRR
ncbi:hypothetical protein AAFF_G00286650 [Aldrovandia affinis]|uniref:C2H2-type domain-containing protein n=1 Tax=Aldrovandia affinis TaxID=143900 RepID=A0AAD7TBS3_9TELE|nr:hypothetical protein AAFF_G00286650 [Aldrovandia affinis]